MLDVGINFVLHYAVSWADDVLRRGEASTPDNWASLCSVEDERWPSGLVCPTPHHARPLPPPKPGPRSPRK